MRTSVFGLFFGLLTACASSAPGAPDSASSTSSAEAVASSTAAAGRAPRGVLDVALRGAILDELYVEIDAVEYARVFPAEGEPSAIVALMRWRECAESDYDADEDRCIERRLSQLVVIRASVRPDGGLELGEPRELADRCASLSVTVGELVDLDGDGAPEWTLEFSCEYRAGGYDEDPDGMQYDTTESVFAVLREDAWVRDQGRADASR